VVLLPDKSRVERGVDPDRRWHLGLLGRPDFDGCLEF
jgi:hypothetical protein